MARWFLSASPLAEPCLRHTLCTQRGLAGTFPRLSAAQCVKPFLASVVSSRSALETARSSSCAVGTLQWSAALTPLPVPPSCPSQAGNAPTWAPALTWMLPASSSPAPLLWGSLHLVPLPSPASQSADLGGAVLQSVFWAQGEPLGSWCIYHPENPILSLGMPFPTSLGAPGKLGLHCLCIHRAQQMAQGDALCFWRAQQMAQGDVPCFWREGREGADRTR